MVKSHERFQCPLCSEIIGPWSRGITFHARNVHDITIDKLWLLKNDLQTSPTCSCDPECTKQLSWYSWERGFGQYAKGHYDKQVRSERTKESLKRSHWSKGKTKETDERLAKMGKKTSQALKEGFASGRIGHWAKGQTKHTHPKIAERSIRLTGTAFHKYKPDVVLNMINDRLSDRFTLDTSIDEIIERKTNRELSVDITCTRCKQKISISAYNVIRKKQQVCPSCDRWSSSFEEEVGDFVVTLDQNIAKRYLISGTELDVFVPEHKFGIECHGLYWHSDKVQPNKFHHQHKVDVCIENEIDLLQVFEDEWRDKRSIVESMIRTRLGKSERYYARKCDVVELTNVERKKFFEETHLDGDVQAKACFALKVGDRVVCALSLKKPFVRGVDRTTLEIARFSSTLNVVVVGGLSKLINVAKTYARQNGFSRLMTYVDMRTGLGRSYENIGFKLDHVTGPRFWWTDTLQRYDRLTCKAHDGIPEKEIASKRRIFKIYGCSNRAYYLNIDSQENTDD